MYGYIFNRKVVPFTDLKKCLTEARALSKRTATKTYAGEVMILRFRKEDIDKLFWYRENSYSPLGMKSVIGLVETWEGTTTYNPMDRKTNKLGATAYVLKADGEFGEKTLGWGAM